MNKRRFFYLTFLLIIMVLPVISQTTNSKPVCPKILGIAHLGYFSNNFEKEKQFYGEYLGFKSYPSRFNKNGVEDMIKYRTGKIQSVELFIENKTED